MAAANFRAALQSGSCSAQLGFGRFHSQCSLFPNMKLNRLKN